MTRMLVRGIERKRLEDWRQKCLKYGHMDEHRRVVIKCKNVHSTKVWSPQNSYWTIKYSNWPAGWWQLGSFIGASSELTMAHKQSSHVWRRGPPLFSTFRASATTIIWRLTSVCSTSTWSHITDQSGNAGENPWLCYLLVITLTALKGFWPNKHCNGLWRTQLEWPTDNLQDEGPSSRV